VPDIHIRRDHQLGLSHARKVARLWAKQARDKFDMTCVVSEDNTGDTVEFTRSGVKGHLVVAADHFELRARLGFLLGAFSKTIEGEIEKTLDELLQASAKSATRAKSPPRKRAGPHSDD